MTNSSPTGRDVTKDRLAADVTALLPSITLPATVGNDQQVMQNNAGTLTMQDLIIATKAIDNTTVPSDGYVLTYDNASGKIKFKAVASSGVSEVQFLQGQAALGKLISVSGSVTAGGAAQSVCSYVPANGTTFVLYQAGYTWTSDNAAAGNFVVQLRNNGTVKATGVAGERNVSGQLSLSHNFPTKGDQLAGDGAKIYDVYWTSTSNSVYEQCAATISGYLL